MPRQLPRFTILTGRLLNRAVSDLRKAEQKLLAICGDDGYTELAREINELCASIGTELLAQDSALAEIAEPYLQEMARLRAERDDHRDRLEAIKSILDEVMPGELSH